MRFFALTTATADLPEVPGYSGIADRDPEIH